MENLWSEIKAAEYVSKYGKQWGEDLALRTYLTSLIGTSDNPVLNGGGSASIKTSVSNILGEDKPVIFVKSGWREITRAGPEGYTGFDLEYLRRLGALQDLADEDLFKELDTHQIGSPDPTATTETLAHALIPKKFVDCIRNGAILALTNQEQGEKISREVFCPDVLILQYTTPGIKLALAAAAAFATHSDSKAMIWMNRGLVCWGETARESYLTAIDLITKAEQYLAKHAVHSFPTGKTTPIEDAEKRFNIVAPILRGLLAKPTENPDWPYERLILRSLITREVLDMVDSAGGKELSLSPPVALDHLASTGILPLWIDDPPFGDENQLRPHIAQALKDFSASHETFASRGAARTSQNLMPLDSRPRIILIPGMGLICAAEDAAAANTLRDVAGHTLAVKKLITSMGGNYRGVAEADLFDLECRCAQSRRQQKGPKLPLNREVALVTGAAGAIGSGIAKELMEQGCHVAVTDLPGKNLDDLVDELAQIYGPRVIGVPLDVTDVDSVSGGFCQVIRAWGGIDLIVINQGIAHVSQLTDLNLATFKTLEKINTEGTLLILSEAGKHFKSQNTGGDIILVSTKNVFSPGANFGAYSATKAAAHQLARIASLEFAPLGVRVNMVAPDAVFSEGRRKSGLWQTVGPDRARARGLNPDALEEFYRDRNLLKSRVTASHVAKAVLFFATHQTPTTGATIPVDGGLPDATPR
jgi:rhamnose utilization protein RhaD (predicted bifunctional aldolase and dehydrogenase)/NAD(P)-dependent dehydrogenase (short-subunit alcohol dehydrogenase family)